MYRSSGIGIYLQNLLPRLAHSIPENRMTLLANADSHEALASALPRAEIRRLSSRIYTIAEQLELFRHARRDVVWWSPHLNIPLAYSGRMVVTVHDLFHLTSPEIRRNPIKLAYASTMFQRIRRRAHTVICVSHFTAREFDRLVGARPKQLHVITNGLDEGWLEPVAGERPQQKPYFLFVGNLKPNKNVNGLIRAFIGISTGIPHDLVIVGQRAGFITGDREAESLARAVGTRVKFTGFVELKELRCWYRYATALVFPSFYEGFGFPPLEAMAVNCPAIVSNAASLPEVCGDAALYCNPGDPASIGAAMLRIIDDDELRDRLVARGKTQIQKFSWSRAAADTAEVLHRAAHGEA
jgi:glycosyltransferase involved in cell wall biosynthesis